MVHNKTTVDPSWIGAHTVTDASRTYIFKIVVKDCIKHKFVRESRSPIKA